MEVVAIDLETYCDVDLPKEGLPRYAESPYLKVLVAGVSRMEPREKEVMGIDTLEEQEILDALQNIIDCADVVVAHNAAFEMTVLRAKGLRIPEAKFVDTAVMARAFGYGGSLQEASNQALGSCKLPEGGALIQLFSVPNPDREDPFFDRTLIDRYPDEFDKFKDYCLQDADLCLSLWAVLDPWFTARMHDQFDITDEMNRTGWYVDPDLLQRMQDRYEENIAEIKERFAANHADAPNLNSSQQMSEWCKKRGIILDSFAEEKVVKAIQRLEKRLTTTQSEDRARYYRDVLELLHARKAVSNSSLKKLDVIGRLLTNDSRLKDQYVHCGAGATWRTSGRGAQMQNLPKLGSVIKDVSDVSEWTNKDLSENLRQLFMAEHPDGQLIVGDFASVESRGLAFLAGEDWKLVAYRNKVPIYESLAAKSFSIPVESVNGEQRKFGKVGELGCGYGAGAQAVKDFAEKMGVILTLEEAETLVFDWRKACPRTVSLWDELHELMLKALSSYYQPMELDLEHVRITMTAREEPSPSLRGTALLIIHVDLKGSFGPGFTRHVRGVTAYGRQVVYHKPSGRKTGPEWTNSFLDPKTKKHRKFTLYGGKLCGIITQSLCRELFFLALQDMRRRMRGVPNVKLVGQFHDEMDMEWWPSEEPGAWTLAEAIAAMYWSMTSIAPSGFPLEADVKSAHRYIK